jgi:dipeptidyl aminopeptidase/acylaminoacyl peptidase
VIVQVWLVEYSKGNGNTAFYLHRRGTFPPQLLFQQQPALRNYTLAPTHPIVITVRDGLQIPGYLTLPVLPQISAQLPAAVTGDVPDRRSFAVMQRSSSTTPKQQQQQQGVSKVDWRLPMVLMVHGGPWRRTSWGSSASLTQWLANRGYAVLNVNFRGSTGYGKAFSYKGERSPSMVLFTEAALTRPLALLPNPLSSPISSSPPPYPPTVPHHHLLHSVKGMTVDMLQPLSV